MGQTDVKVSHGWVYISDPVDHPAVLGWDPGETYYYRFHMQPEVVADISQKIDLSDHIDVPFYRRWAKRLQRVPELKQQPPEAFDFDYYDFGGFPPFPHQRIALAFCLYLPAVGLFSDKGTGKTYTALKVTDIRHQLGLADKTLVIAPKTTLWTTWYEECVKFTDLDAIIAHKGIGSYQWTCPWCDRHYYYVSDTHAKNHWRRLNTLAHICGQPKVTKTETDAERFKTYGSLPLKELAWNKRNTLEEKLKDGYDLYIATWGALQNNPELLIDADFDQVILDESTHIRTADGITTKAAHKLSHHVKYRLAMTGTPMGNQIADVWPQMYFVDQSLGPNVTDFRDRYLMRPAPQEYPDFWVPRHDGIQDLVINRVDNRCLRLSKDVLDLPDRRVQEIETDLSGRLQDHYQTMDEEGYVYLPDKNLEIVAFDNLSKTQKLQQISNGFINQSFQDNRPSIPHLLDPYPPKIQTLCRLVERIDGKAIIWYIFEADRILLQFHLWYYCQNFAQLHGGVTGRAIDRNIRSFKNDPGCRFMLAHPKSAQFGHTWNVANHTIYYSYGQDLIEYTQSRDRNHRLGQHDEVTEFIIIGSDKDREIYDNLVESKTASDNFSNDTRFKTKWEQNPV